MLMVKRFITWRELFTMMKVWPRVKRPRVKYHRQKGWLKQLASTDNEKQIIFSDYESSDHCDLDAVNKYVDSKGFYLD